MSALSAVDVSRFITARALIGQGGHRMEVALDGETGRVFLSLQAYEEIAHELHDNREIVGGIRALVHK